MNAVLRHFAARLWATALAGGLICMAVLPQWQRLVGLQWMAVPVMVVLSICFLGFGWLMNRWGDTVIRRLVAEAAVWERGGMGTEAEKAFERAKAIYDSFWLSPVQRRRLAGWITMRLARFYLARPTHGPDGQRMVASYLHLRPGDEAVAVGWLEGALSREVHTRADHDVAARINSALPDNANVQQLLMQFYLADMRADFEAIQTYRRVWRHGSQMAGERIKRLARVLLNEAYITDWALQVYLKAYSLGETDCLEAIAAGRQVLYPNEQNQDYLKFADQIVSKLGKERRQQLAQQFLPAADSAGKTKGFRLPKWVEKGFDALDAFLHALTTRVRRSFSSLRRAAGKRAEQGFPVPRVMVTLIVLAMAGIIATVAWRAMSRVPEPSPPPPITPVQPVAPSPVTDPFTIQVAAYMNQDDAQVVVDQLKQARLDAFWTKAASTNRTWYQVKISHFPTKTQARAYGEMLKSKGLIDDFYVANYAQ